MKFTKKDLEQYKSLDDKFKNIIMNVLNITEEMKIGKSPGIDYDDIEGIEFYNGEIEIGIYESSGCSCCPSGYNYYNIPEDYVYELDLEKLQKEIDAEKKKKLKRQEKIDEEERIKKENRERKLLKQLQEKYSE